VKIKVCAQPGFEFEGKPHPGCVAHVKASNPERAERRGFPCRNQPMHGQEVCHAHGGRSPQARKAARERNGMVKARAAVAAFGLARDVSPTEALLEEVRWAAGHVAWLREQIARFDAGPRALTMDPEGKALLDLYGEERDRLIRVSKIALDADVDERLVRRAERDGAELAGMIGRILVRLQLTPEQETLVGTVVPSELRALAGGGEAS
jgi:hypothetical protein